MNIGIRLGGERAIPVFLVALSLLSYARLYMLRDVYADDNNWLLGIYLGYDLPGFLETGFKQMRREPLGVFLYFFFLPFRYLENPYVVWHTIVLAAQVSTALVLVKLVDNLCGDKWLSAFVATAFIVAPLDFSIGYLSGFNYRVALLLCLASLYLTDSAARRHSWGWRWPASVMIGLLSEYMFHEASIGFEPVRLLLLWNRFHHSGQPIRTTLRTVMKFWAPFLLLSVPLVVYKLLFPPFGIYSGMYSLGFSHFTNREEIEGAITVFTFGHWELLQHLGSYASWGTRVLGFAGAFAVLALLLKMKGEQEPSPPRGPRPYGLLGIFAIALLAAQLFIFFFGGRPPNGGTDTTHAILMQPAYAVIVGTFAYAVARRFGKPYFWATSLLIALGCGFGTYFNNLNLDMYAEASSQQSEFWSAFKARFPSLPEHADFLIDARPRYKRKIQSFYGWEDLHANYTFEFPLNQIYAPKPQIRTVRNHRVYSSEEFVKDFRWHGAALGDNGIRRQTSFGIDTLDARAMTVILYRDGRLLINREIIGQYPKSDYRWLADKPLPPWATKGN